MQVFIPYNEKANINYIYLLYLHQIAQSNNNKYIKDTIKFKSLQELEDRINTSLIKYRKDNKKLISKSTLNRILNSQDYKDYLTYNVGKKEIILNNNFINAKNKRFVVLKTNVIDVILRENNNFFAKYCLYIIYYCGYSKNKTTDFTAKQFLIACGYSNKSGKYITQVSAFNKILQNEKIISIDKYRDISGRERNRYKVI